MVNREDEHFGKYSTALLCPHESALTSDAVLKRNHERGFHTLRFVRSPADADFYGILLTYKKHLCGKAKAERVVPGHLLLH